MHKHAIFYTLLLFLFAACTEPSVDSGIGEVGIAAEFSPDEYGPGLDADGLKAEAEARYRELTAAPTNGRSSVVLEAGSVDKLAEAIAIAGEGGTVIVAAGDHSESGTVIVDLPVNIIGEDGATITFAATGFTPPTIPFTPALHVKDVARANLRNLTLVSADGKGNTGVLIDNAPRTAVIDCTMESWQWGIMIEQSPLSFIAGNTISGVDDWLTDPTLQVFGIVNINGSRAMVYNNTVSNTVFGIWACDRGGTLVGNETFGNYNGVILCKVPVGIPLPGGRVVGADLTSTRWGVVYNNSHDNFNSGFEVIDGADRNYIAQNTVSNNFGQDYEFAGETERYGFLAPPSVRNWANLYSGDTYKDCGDKNRIEGGFEISTEDSPCF